jgi:mannose/fructose/N-acetylgalactosamine-specific phosphotransferase system component IIC
MVVLVLVIVSVCGNAIVCLCAYFCVRVCVCVCVLTGVCVGPMVIGVSVGANVADWLTEVPLGAAVVGDWPEQISTPSGLQIKG